MKALQFLSLLLVALLFSSCMKDDDMEMEVQVENYLVMVENVSTDYMYFESGVSSIPEGASEAGPALPGNTFKFSFHAGPGHKLSFASMYGFSNDGFYAPSGDGISLFEDGAPIENADITSQIMLWDAGTEENQMPGMDNPHDGMDVTDGMVKLMQDVNDGYNYGMVSTNLKVTLQHDGDHMFTLMVENMAASTTAISPVVWVVHSAANPLFESGMKDYGMGLENVAETGNAAELTDNLMMKSGYVSPVAPILWVLHDNDDMPIFTNNAADRGEGLELLAETGNPGDLAEMLKDMGYEAGAQAIPDGKSTAGPLFPGDMYTFTIDAEEGQYLSFASMLGNSNDVFFAFDDLGIKLDFGDTDTDVTDQVMLWDAGTEVNEYPGTKSMDVDEGGTVRILNDGYTYPAVNDILKITIRKN